MCWWRWRSGCWERVSGSSLPMEVHVTMLRVLDARGRVVACKPIVGVVRRCDDRTGRWRREYVDVARWRLQHRRCVKASCA